MATISVKLQTQSMEIDGKEVKARILKMPPSLTDNCNYFVIVCLKEGTHDYEEKEKA